MLEVLGYLATVLSCAAFVPQVFKTWKTKSANDVSIEMFGIQAVASISWIIYGFAKASPPVYLTNIVLLTLATAQILLKIKYDRAARKVGA